MGTLGKSEISGNEIMSNQNHIAIFIDAIQINFCVVNIQKVK